MNPAWTTLTSSAVLLKRDDIDTDQIIPARFLTTTTRQGLGKHLFADWRYHPDGTPRPEFVLNTPGAQGAQILVAGQNFGCGSSREHAPWALVDHGIRAVVAGSFADIFRSNAHKNGLLTIALDPEVLAELHRVLESAADTPPVISVDLPAQQVMLPTGGGPSAAPDAGGGGEPVAGGAVGSTMVSFAIDPFGKRCLVEGLDELGALVAELPTIEAWEAACGR
jgi:3-isopropylmalate/(R)-2-methylmalate dehydratase small subunit